MRRITLLSIALATALSPIATGIAQAQEIIVTASRVNTQYYEDKQTVIGLKRVADFAVQSVAITSDSRDPEARKQEIMATVEAAIRRANAAGVELSTGEVELVPLTLENFRDLDLYAGNRSDTSEVRFYAKSKLSGSKDTARERIAAFIKAVPVNGRSLVEARGGTTLSIINPDQYRDEIVKMVAAESIRYAGYFGAEYGVEVSGLNEQLVWAQASGTEVFLYIPYRFSIRPKA